MNTKLSTAIKWAALGALAMIIYTILLYILDVSYSSKLRWGGFLILLAVIVMGSYEFRDKVQGGFASFGELFGFIAILGTIYGILVSIFGYINVSFIDTNMIADIMLETEIRMEEQGMPDVQIEQAMAFSKKMMSPVWMLISGFLSGFISSLIMALPTAGIISRRKDVMIDFVDETEEN